MKAVVRIIALALLVFPAFVSAQEPQAHPLAGTWSTIPQQDAPEARPIIFEFRIQGDVVTGPIFANGFERYIQTGTVTANTIAFVSPGLGENEQSQRLTWTGQLSGNGEISFTVVTEGQETPAREFTVKRHVIEQR